MKFLSYLSPDVSESFLDFRLYNGMWFILAETSKNEWGKLGINTERTVAGLSTLL